MITDSVKKIIGKFPEEITAPAPTPAVDHLLKVRDDSESKKLPEEQAAIFHNATVKLLFTAG